MNPSNFVASPDFTPDPESGPRSGVVVRRGDIAFGTPVLPPVRPRMSTLLGLGDGDFDTRATLPLVRSEDLSDDATTPASWACSLRPNETSEPEASNRAPQVALHDDVDPNVVASVRKSAEHLLAIRAFERRRSLFGQLKNWFQTALLTLRHAVITFATRFALSSVTRR